MDFPTGRNKGGIEVNKILFLKRKAILGTIISVIVLFSTNTLVPAVYGNHTNNFIDAKREFFANTDEGLLEFINEIYNVGADVNDQEVFEKFNAYLRKQNYEEITYHEFGKFINLSEIYIGKDNNDLFMSFLSYLFNEANREGFKLRQFYRQFNTNCREVFKNINQLHKIKDFNSIQAVEDRKENDNSFKDLNIYTNNNKDFDNYWEWYSKGKKIWAGNFVDDEGNIRQRPLLIINSWNGSNFSDWYYNAANFLWGIEGVVDYPMFRLINNGLSLLSFIFFVISIIGYFSGIVGNSEVGFAVGGLFGIFGYGIIFILLFWDWYILLYFLFGTNAFLMMFEWGNVEFNVEVTGNQTLIDSCIVHAASLSAKEKYIETGGTFNKVDVKWYLSEFEYELKIQNENNEENSSWHSICYPEYTYDDEDKDKAHKQWEKAVPPPGDWRISVLDENGNILGEKIVEGIEPRTCYHVKFEL